MEEKFEKFKEFINDNDNGLIVRIGMVLVGAIIGILLILLSGLFPTNVAISVSLITFGVIIFGVFVLGAAVWYISEN